MQTQMLLFRLVNSKHQQYSWKRRLIVFCFFIDFVTRNDIGELWGSNWEVLYKSVVLHCSQNIEKEVVRFLVCGANQLAGFYMTPVLIVSCV